MLQRFARGWGIAKASWAVLKLHPKLMIFPALSLVSLLALLGVIAGSVFAQLYVASEHFTKPVENLNIEVEGTPLNYALFFGFYLLLVFIGTFFNAALVFCTLEAFAGRTPSLRAGLATAVGRLPQILAWTVVTATVGLLLNMLQETLRERLGFLGAILGGLLEFVWAVATYFVVPVLVVDGVGPVEAVKRSAGILKRTWGEHVAGSGGLGLIGFLLALIPGILLAAGISLAGAAASPKIFLAVMVPVFVLYLLTLGLVFSTLGAIFRTGTYVYATTGQAPSDMDPALLQGAFRKK